MKKGVHYNYNLEECNWLIKQGAKVLGCGNNTKTGNPYLVFLANDFYKELDRVYKTQ